MKQFKPRNAIVIFGMHRCGTSTVSGILSLLGFHLGKDLIPPLEENPKGFYENILINQFNDHLLESIGITWHTTGLLQDGWWTENAVLRSCDELKDILNDQFSDEDRIVIKDPRLSILWPFYESIFSEMKITPHFIISLRNPSEVAASLFKRNQFSAEKSILIWMDYMLKAEYHSRNFSRHILLFDDLISNPVIAIQNILADFNFDYTMAPDVKNEVVNFVENDLKHYNLPTILAQHQYIPEIFRLFQEISKAKGRGMGTNINQILIDEISSLFYDKLFFFNGTPRIRHQRGQVPD